MDINSFSPLAQEITVGSRVWNCAKRIVYSKTPWNMRPSPIKVNWQKNYLDGS